MVVKSLERTMGALVILLVCLISTAALADDSYLCIGEHATGFTFDEKNKTWSTSKIHNHKYVVKKSTEPEYKIGIYKFGEEDPSVKCGEGFNKSGNLICDCKDQLCFGEFRMSKSNLRFLYVYPFGYWSDVTDASSSRSKGNKWLKEGENTPNMEIGKCSKI